MFLKPPPTPKPVLFFWLAVLQTMFNPSQNHVCKRFIQHPHTRNWSKVWHSHVEICGTMVAILHGEMTHKYLGRKFPSNLKSRTEVELIYRMQCAWSKFHQHKLIVLNKHVTLRLRLKLFHATVSSTAMFGLASLPLTQRFLHKLDVVQRRMLRSIVGWVRIPDEPWENTMRRMNQRMEHVAYLHPLPSWSNQYFTSQYRLANQFS